jgi:hypothetical protein
LNGGGGADEGSDGVAFAQGVVDDELASAAAGSDDEELHGGSSC